MAPLVAILGTALTPLLQTLIAGFTTANQSKVTAAMSKAGWESTAAQQFAEQTMTAAKALADQALQAAGLMPPAGAPGAVSQPPPDLASVAEAIAIVKRDPALIAQVEATAMDYVDKMGPLLDKLAELEAREWEANEDSKDRAAKRQHEFVSADGWDMTRTLALGGLGFIGVLATFVCAIAAWQTYLNGVPSTEVWAAITGLIGTAAGILTTIFAFRFGTNRASAAKDVTNAALAGELAARRR